MTITESKAQNIDLTELDRYLGSINFTIPTKSILDLQQKVENWISMKSFDLRAFRVFYR